MFKRGDKKLPSDKLNKMWDAQHAIDVGIQAAPPLTITNLGGRPCIRLQENLGFWALITAVDVLTGQYTWTEQIWEAGGTWVDKPNGRSGNPASCPAYELDDKIADTSLFPFRKWLSPGFQDESASQEYWFDLDTINVSLSDGTELASDVSRLEFDPPENWEVSQPEPGVAVITYLGSGTGSPFDLTVERIDDTQAVDHVNVIKFAPADDWTISEESPGVAVVTFDGSGSGWTVERSDGSQAVFDNTTLQVDPPALWTVSQPATHTARIALTPSPCAPITTYETDVRCEFGLLNIYKRPININITVDGSGICLSKNAGGWLLWSNAGCCDCVDHPPTGTGTGTGTGCVPGNCAVCVNPPGAPDQWIIDIFGFTGACDVFNGLWILFNNGSCVWTATASVAGILVTVELTVGGGDVTVNFTYGNVFATYRTQLSADNCCTPYQLQLVTSSCSPAGGACAECDPTRGVPLTWTVTIDGCAGDYIYFNGTWTLTYFSPCLWFYNQPFGDLLVIRLYLSQGAGLPGTGEYLLSLTHAGSDPEGHIGGGIEQGTEYYLNNVPLPLDCCDPVAIPWTGLSTKQWVPHRIGPPDAVPTSLTVVPNCPDGTAPLFLIAAPSVCCDSGTGTGTGCVTVCNCCPIDISSSFTFTLSGFVGGDCVGLNGTWTLHHVGLCQWQGGFGDFGFTLTCENGLWTLTTTPVGEGVGRAGPTTWSGTTFDCCLGGTLNLVSSSCSPAQSSVTLTGAGCTCDSGTGSGSGNCVFSPPTLTVTVTASLCPSIPDGSTATITLTGSEWIGFSSIGTAWTLVCVNGVYTLSLAYSDSAFSCNYVGTMTGSPTGMYICTDGEPDCCGGTLTATVS